MDGMQPGQLIVPHGPSDPKPTPDGSPEPERPVEEPEPAPQPAPTPEPAAPAVISETATPAPAQPAASGGWQFRQEAEVASSSFRELPEEDLSWTASEFIAHEKGAGWYGLLALGAIVAAALVYFVTRDKVSTAVVVFVAAALGFFGGRKPHTQQYNLTGRGLQIGQKFYGFQDFKTFSIVEEGAIASISFAPLKRFMPPLTIYVAPDIEERVVNFLSSYLPLEARKADMVDNLLKRMRF